MNRVAAMNQELATLLQALRSERPGKAYRRLLELGPAALPQLMESFEAESDPRIRAILLEIVRQVRSPESLDFLSRAFEDENPLVWKVALDGLVTLGGSAAVQALEAAREHSGSGYNPEKRAWLNQALGRISKSQGS